METPTKPKKKVSLASLGVMLIIGGIIILSQKGSTDKIYEGEPTGSSWATIVAVCFFVAGGVTLLVGVAKTINDSN